MKRSVIKKEVEHMGHVEASEVEAGAREHWCTCIQDEMLRVKGGNKWPCSPDATLLKRCFSHVSTHMGATDLKEQIVPSVTLITLEGTPKACPPSAQCCLLSRLGASVYLQALAHFPSRKFGVYSAFHQQCSHSLHLIFVWLLV